MEAYKGSRGTALLILSLRTIPAMLYIIPMPKCYKQAVTQAIIPTVSVLRSWKRTVYGSTHTRYQHFDRQSMKRACPWQRLLLHIGDKTTLTRFSIVWTTVNTLNVSVRHLTIGLCEEHCRRLQNTDSATLTHSSAVSPSHDTHKTNVHHMSVRTPGRIYTKFNTNIRTSKPSQSETPSDLLQVLIGERTATRYGMDDSGFEPW